MQLDSSAINYGSSSTSNDNARWVRWRTQRWQPQMLFVRRWSLCKLLLLTGADASVPKVLVTETGWDRLIWWMFCRAIWVTCGNTTWTLWNGNSWHQIWGTAKLLSRAVATQLYCIRIRCTLSDVHCVWLDCVFICRYIFGGRRAKRLPSIVEAASQTPIGKPDPGRMRGGTQHQTGHNPQVYIARHLGIQYSAEWVVRGCVYKREHDPSRTARSSDCDLGWHDVCIWWLWGTNTMPERHLAFIPTLLQAFGIQRSSAQPELGIQKWLRLCVARWLSNLQRRFSALIMALRCGNALLLFLADMVRFVLVYNIMIAWF